MQERIYLLQPENNTFMLTAHDNGERRSTHGFLKMVVAQKPEVRVLLDVGAQMLELQNLELAEAWLKLSPDTLAASYSDEDGELAVVTRGGTTQLLLSLPFAQQLDHCVVYLDGAHTRAPTSSSLSDSELQLRWDRRSTKINADA
ncbi:hypothetical protein PAXRUDRAFT_10988 [Paxillus rubicundulus Ve08.2h10]|uniref:Uncharacterized protein n=1 Tax=Paxillus rubicundulus Ve08.2h10 TaxID=930991 RepID=A0A0D0DS70_9AGAM|nr:hypothetical protein PAXRUDRAFT_10988 [Paxillus rubicundulus Ve08.2h10]